MKVNYFQKSLEKQPFSLPTKWGEHSKSHDLKVAQLVHLENWIVLRIFYVPSAVGRPISHMSSTQTLRRIRSDGDDRQRTQWYLLTVRFAPVRSTGRWNSYETECTVGRYVPFVQGVEDKYEQITIDTNNPGWHLLSRCQPFYKLFTEMRRFYD